KALNLAVLRRTDLNLGSIGNLLRLRGFSMTVAERIQYDCHTESSQPQQGWSGILKLSSGSEVGAGVTGSSSSPASESSALRSFSGACGYIIIRHHLVLLI